MNEQIEVKKKEKSQATKMFAYIGMASVLVMVLAGAFLPFQNVNSQSETIANFAEDEEDDHRRTITVSGSHEISVAPEKVDVYVSVVSDSLKAKDSQAQNALDSQKVINALLAVGVKSTDIETTSYSLNEINEWNNTTNKYDRKGYRTTNSLKITLANINDAGKIIDASITAGANRVDNIIFGLKDATQEQLKLQALEQASAVSKEKAMVMANGVGVTIVALDSMTENSNYYVPYYNTYQRAADSAGGVAESAPTEIYAGDIKISANVSATYTIK